MDLFIKIKDTKLNEELNVNIQQIKRYNSKDEDDKKIIFYELSHNVYLEEQFDNDSDRQAKLDILKGLTV